MNEIDEARKKEVAAFYNDWNKCGSDSCVSSLMFNHEGLIVKALEAYAAPPEITRGSGDVFKDMGLEQAPFPTLKGENDE